MATKTSKKPVVATPRYDSLPTTTLVTKNKAVADNDAALVIFAAEGGQPLIAGWPKRAPLRKYLSFQLKRTDFTGKNGQVLTLRPPVGLGTGLVILVGLGNATSLQTLALEAMGGRLVGALARENFTTATLLLGNDVARATRKSGFSISTVAAHMVTGLRLGQYHFGRYKTPKADKKDTTLTKLHVVTPDRSLGKALEPLNGMIAGITLARDVVSEPPNVINPTTYSQLIKETLEPVGVKVTIIDATQAKAMGMGGLVGVGQGSQTPPCLVVMEWAGKNAGKGKPLKNIPAFVGKGVTFDTGGYSIKPANGMHDMKYDMGGSAAVIGAMYAMALQQSVKPAVGIVALAENMVDQSAYRPGDILHLYGGKTVEVLNTDAEGRLVLADALTYIQKTYDPSLVIDLATLTGAIRVALGTEIAGVFVNDDTLWASLEQASASSGSRVWRMPLDPMFHRMIESDVADLMNIGGWSGLGGSCTAAAFLESFIDAKRPWAHIDIAGTAWATAASPTTPKGATGYGVRLLLDLAQAQGARKPRMVKRRRKALANAVATPGVVKKRGRPPGAKVKAK
ncbi:MAG: leucyl aminopeptidase [Pseudomonadota bacterium]